MDTFVEHIVGEIARSKPDKVAIRCQGQGLTYAGLACNSRAMAGWLEGQGLGLGDRVVLVLPDSFSLALAIMGCCLSGVVFVPLNDRLRQADIADCLAHCGAKLLMTSPGHEALAAAAEVGVPARTMTDDDIFQLLAGFPADRPAAPVSPEDIAMIFYTSGTTGHPKGVPHRHVDFSLIVKVVGQDFIGLREDDVVLCSAKLCHVYGFFFALVNPLALGATALLDPERPNPKRTLELLREEGVTVLGSVPAIYGMLLLSLEGNLRCPRLRLCFSAGEALPAAIFHAWMEKTGLPLWEGYGHSETATFVIGSRPPDMYPGRCGRAIPPFEAKIVDEALRPVPPGTPGQVAVRSPTLMPGYLNAPEWTAKAFALEDWYLSGDMGKEEDGVITILGRTDDMFKAGGLWVSPTRVESALLSHPAVAQCAVVGGRSGAFTLVRAHVVPAPGHEPGPALLRTLREHSLRELPDYMAPTDIVFQESLPLTATGKVQRYKLRASMD